MTWTWRVFRVRDGARSDRNILGAIVYLIMCSLGPQNDRQPLVGMGAVAHAHAAQRQEAERIDERL